ncbi:MAG: substrate-binding domain-containing protein [Geminicoccaceae bacterium]
MALYALAYVVYNHTRFGGYVIALGNSEENAKLAGIDTDRVKIGVFMFSALCSGDAIAAYNEAFPDLEVTGRWLSAEGSLEKMIQQAEVTINEKPDVMFVNAINVDAFEPLVKTAQEAGITWVAVHSPMDSADYSFTLGDIANGTNQGLAMCALSGGEPYKVGVMLGQAGNPSGEARREGILKGLEACDNVEVVAEQPADWDTVKAQSIA